MSKKFLIGSLMILGILTTSQVKAGDGENDGGFGIKGGVGLTTIGFEKESAESQKNKMKVGGMVGISYEKRFGNVFALDIEALYANKGVRQKSEATILGKDYEYIAKSNLHYFEIPLSAKFYIGDNVNLYVGGYGGFLAFGQAKTKTIIDGKEQNETESDNYFKEANKDINGEYALSRFDAGLNGGVEFISNKGFGVGARFQKGLMDITNKKYILDDNKWVTNTGIQIYGIIRF